MVCDQTHTSTDTHMHTVHKHTLVKHTYMYIYVCVYMYVCICDHTLIHIFIHYKKYIGF